MKSPLGLALAVVIASAFVLADEVSVRRQESPATSPAIRSDLRNAWLGLKVSKPDETTAAHLPSLPPGVGFVIKSVDGGGPAEEAGVQPLDLLWKFGDQMLVNEAQLATLLSHHQPGDEVPVTLFRGGQPLSLMVTLGKAPRREHRYSRRGHDGPGPRGEAVPMKVVNFGDRYATYTGDDGRASIKRQGEGYKLLIRDREDRVVFDDELAADWKMEKVPGEWRRRVCALRRGLDHASEGRMTPVRPERPRVIPPSTQSP